MNLTNEIISSQMFNSSGIYIKPEFKIFFNLILVLLLTVGVLGNGLVIYVVGRFSSMQTPTNIHMMSLSISDCVYLITIPFTLAVINMENFVFGVIVCKLYMISHGVNWFAGTYSLTVMSIDRYLAVVHPIRSQPIRTTRVTTVIVLCLWIIGLIVMLPVMLYSVLVPIGWPRFYDDSSNITTDNQTMEMDESILPDKWACQILWPASQSITAFTWYTFLLGFLIPVSLITCLYTQVILRLRKVGPENRSKGRRDSISRITRLVLAIVIIYIVLWLPYWIHQLMLPYIPMSQDSIYIAMTLQILGYANSALNPILYGFMSHNFRVMFKQLLCCRQQQRPEGRRLTPSEFSNASQSTRRGGQLASNQPASIQRKIDQLNNALFENNCESQQHKSPFLLTKMDNDEINKSSVQEIPFLERRSQTAFKDDERDLKSNYFLHETEID